MGWGYLTPCCDSCVVLCCLGVIGAPKDACSAAQRSVMQVGRNGMEWNG